MNRCRRTDGSQRAWFATREEAVAFEADLKNWDYRGDVPVRCTKCLGWYLSQPSWPDAIAARATLN
jgi:hypothetical protein